jgi:hypothetical protein
MKLLAIVALGLAFGTLTGCMFVARCADLPVPPRKASISITMKREPAPKTKPAAAPEGSPCYGEWVNDQTYTSHPECRQPAPIDRPAGVP